MTFLAFVKHTKPRAEGLQELGAPALDFEAAAPASEANLVTQNSGSHSGDSSSGGPPALNDNSGVSRDHFQRASNHGEHDSPAQRGLSVRKTSGDRDKNKNAQRAFRQRKKEKEKAKCALIRTCSSDNFTKLCMLSTVLCPPCEACDALSGSDAFCDSSHIFAGKIVQYSCAVQSHGS